MKFLRTLAWMLLGGFIGAASMAVVIAEKTFDVPTLFGTVTCFKLK